VKELREDEIDRKAAGLRAIECDEDLASAKRAGIDAASGSGPLPGRHPAFGRLFTAPTQGGKKLVEGMFSKGADELPPAEPDDARALAFEKAAEPSAPLAVKPKSRYTLSVVYLASEGGTPSPEELEQATWRFGQSSDFSVHDADSGAQVGEVVEITFNKARGEGGFDNAPENSVIAGIIWTPEAFPRAAAGELWPRLGGPFAGTEPRRAP
jgi:hypothetical protein